MYLSWQPSKLVRTAYVHKKIVPALCDALMEIREYEGRGYLHLLKYDHFGGCYNYRVIRGGQKLSTHSWAISWDQNPHLGPYKGTNNQPQFIIDAFINRGFVSFPWDGMHFQAVKSSHPKALFI
jgi:hypothetical protein